MFDDTPVRMLETEELSLSPESEDEMTEEELSEHYLPIGDVAKSIGVNASVLRFWEQEFPQLKPHKRGNRRYYSQADVELIRTIQHLLYEEHYTIIGARNRIHEMQVQKKVTERFGEELAKPIVPNVARLTAPETKAVLAALKDIRKDLRDALGIVDDPFLTDAEKDAPDSPRVKPEDDAPEVAPEVNQEASPAAEEPAPVSEQPALKVPPLPGQEQAFTAGMPVGEKKESSLIFSSPIFWKR